MSYTFPIFPRVTIRNVYDGEMTDTAQSYRNEEEAGIAIRESGLGRDDIFITTKYSGLDGLDIKTSIANSLKNVIFFSS